MKDLLASEGVEMKIVDVFSMTSIEVGDSDALMLEMLASISWEKRDDYRIEAFFKRYEGDYLQPARANGIRPYFPQEEPTCLKSLWELVEQATGYKYEACFINFYLDERANMGWHFDNSPSIDVNRPVSVLSLGGEREIFFRDAKTHDVVMRLMPKAGSVYSMLPKCNEHFQHCIPPTNEKRMPRMSLVFRPISKIDSIGT